MIALERTTPEAMEQQAAEAGIALHIEQTTVWAGYQAPINGRTHWGA